jgi:hypothetical protein
MKIIKVDDCNDCPEFVMHKDTPGTGWCSYQHVYVTIADGFPDWCPLEDAPDPHELWAVAQFVPGEGIEDGVGRVKELLGEQT